MRGPMNDQLRLSFSKTICLDPVSLPLDRKLWFKAGVHLKPVFPPLNLGLTRISRSRFKHSQNSQLISQSCV